MMYTYIYAGRHVYLYTFIHTSIAISAQVRSAQVRRAALQQFLTMSTPARRVRAKKTIGLAALANGVKTLNALQENDDLNYIIAELKGPKRKLVQSVATLLRSGQLEKEEIVAQDGLGARIKKGVSSYKGLGAKFLMAFLRRALPPLVGGRLEGDVQRSHHAWTSGASPSACCLRRNCRSDRGRPAPAPTEPHRFGYRVCSGMRLGVFWDILGLLVEIQAMLR